MASKSATDLQQAPFHTLTDKQSSDEQTSAPHRRKVNPLSS